MILVAIGCALASTPASRAQTPAEDTPDSDTGLLAASNFTDANAIDSLPVNGRQWESLGLLASTANAVTVAAGGSGDGEADLADGRNGAGRDSSSSAGLSYGGLAPTQNAATLDGLSMEQNFSSRPRGGGGRGSVSGAPVSGASFAQGALRSYRVMPGTYSAEFGGAAGAVLAIASRAGTDAWHGEAYSMARISAFDATNPFSVVTHYRNSVITNSLVKPEDTTVQLGGHISIPLLLLLPGKQGKKLSLFASWEEMLRDDPAISSPETSNFYELTPSQTSLLGNRGVTAVARNAALNYLDSLTGTVSRFSTRGLGFVRVDDAVSSHDHIVATYAHNRFDFPAGSGFRSASNAVVNSGVASVGDSFVNVDAVAAHWQHTFSPKLRNTLRLQFVRDFEFEVPRTPLPQEPAVSPGGFAPEIEIAPNGFTYGTPANLGRTAYPDEKRAQAVEQLEWIRGRHLLTTGFDWSHIDDRVASYTNADGTFLYDSGATGDSEGGLVDWITDYTFNIDAYPNGGCPSITATVHDPCFRSYTQSFGPAQTQFVTHTFAGYAQDAFHIRHDLLITLGARYEYVLLPLPQTPNKVLDEDLRGLTTQVQGATASFPEDRNNAGPRAALSWTPHGGKGITARLGYGLFYGRLAGTTVQSALANTALPSTTLQIRIRPTTTALCPQITNVQQGFGYPCAFDTTPPSAVAETSSATLFSKNFRLPAVQRATLSLERDLGKHAFLRAAYAMALATQLPSTTDLNIASATSSATFMIQGGDDHPDLHTGRTFTIPLYTQRRLTQYGPVTALVSNANATYHAATLEAELRSWRGLGVRGSFTFSRAIDYAPLISGTPRTNGQFDPFRNGYDKGLSTLQFPERFSGDIVYRSHITQGPRPLRQAFNAWRIATIASAGSGAPYSYEISGGSYLSGGHETINGAGGATYLPTVGRNTLRLPARGSVDLRVERPFELRKGIRINAFAEAFNLLNKRNLTRVETRAFLPEPASTSPTPVGCPVLTAPTLVFQDAAAISCEGLTTPAFGQPTSSTSGVSRERELELGLRLQF